MKRAALIAGVSIATLVCAGPTKVSAAWSAESWWSRSPAVLAPYPAPRKIIKRSRPATPDRKAGGISDKTPPIPPIPPGPLHVIVSIDKQRATLFADGMPVASTAISSGTASHPTPMGVFTVIQKSRHHVSNLYDAPMPYMQRITWSGSALHEGPLPGYPASHGCVRLTSGFAQLLWKATKMGARVIVTRPDVAPFEFEHSRLFALRPKIAAAPASAPATPDPTTTAAAVNVKIADATHSTAVAVLSVVGDASKPVATSVETVPAANAPAAEQPTKVAVADDAAADPAPQQAVASVAPDEINSAETQPAETKPVEDQPVEAKAVEDQPIKAKAVEVTPAETKSVETKSVEATPIEAKPVAAKPAPTIAAPASIIVDERPKTMPAAVVQEANGRPISVFASLKEGKLYVRQGWKPLFEAPVSFERPDQPIGTHVYTAMSMKAGGHGLRWTVVSIPSSNKRVAELKVSENRKSRSDHAIKAIEVEVPMPSASTALDRIVMPPELVERISELITPGSSLIVSDNRLSDETGEYTDFIVLTR